MRKILSCLVLTGVAFSHPVQAEEAKKPWKNSTEVSAISANGNTKTTSTSAK